MIRRTFLKLLGALLGSAALPRAAPAAVHATAASPTAAVPEWCPAGFVPLMGQAITAEQFPWLFQPSFTPKGRRHIPPFWGEASPVMLEKTLRGDDREVITIMAAVPMVRSNGTHMRPGFRMNFMVARQDLQDSFGPLDLPDPPLVGPMHAYSGYQKLPGCMS